MKIVGFFPPFFKKYFHQRGSHKYGSRAFFITSHFYSLNIKFFIILNHFFHNGSEMREQSIKTRGKNEFYFGNSRHFAVSEIVIAFYDCNLILPTMKKYIKIRTASQRSWNNKWFIIEEERKFLWNFWVYIRTNDDYTNFAFEGLKLLAHKKAEKKRKKSGSKIMILSYFSSHLLMLFCVVTYAKNAQMRAS